MAENRATTQEFADLLAERGGISRGKALKVVQSLFGVIKDGLLQDDFVKIKGLGTFKVVKMGKRESVSVNTKERIVIEEHSRLVFTPDAAFKSRVNRPFENFQTIVFDDDKEAEKLPIDEKEGEETEQTTEVHTIELEGEDRAPEPEREDVMEVKTIDLGETTEEKEETPEQTEVRKEAEEGTDERNGRKHNVSWIAGVAVAVVCLVIGYVAGFNTAGMNRSEQQETTQEEGKEPANAEMAEKTDGTAEVKQDSTRVKVADLQQPTEEKTPEKPTAKEAEELAKQYKQVEGGKYWIVGTVCEHVMGKGDILSRITREVFNEKSYIDYVILYNGIENPDVIPLGTTIKFPKLVEKEGAQLSN